MGLLSGSGWWAQGVRVQRSSVASVPRSSRAPRRSLLCAMVSPGHAAVSAFAHASVVTGAARRRALAFADHLAVLRGLATRPLASAIAGRVLGGDVSSARVGP